MQAERVITTSMPHCSRKIAARRAACCMCWRRAISAACWASQTAVAMISRRRQGSPAGLEPPQGRARHSNRLGEFPEPVAGQTQEKLSLRKVCRSCQHRSAPASRLSNWLHLSRITSLPLRHITSQQLGHTALHMNMPGSRLHRVFARAGHLSAAAREQRVSAAATSSSGLAFFGASVARTCP